MSKRMISIIYILLQESDVCTGDKIATKLRVSVRTIKSEIAVYRDCLEEYGVSIISKKATGYSIKITNKQLFDDFFNPITYMYSHVDEIPDDCDERLNYIIRTLISRESAVHVDELADNLFVVKRSLGRYMQRARKILETYGLKVETIENNGLHLKGTELHKRLCQLDFYTYYYHKSIPNFKVKEFNNLFTTKMEVRLHTRQIILDELRQHNIIIKDFYSQKFPVLLLLSYKRFNTGYEIDIPINEILHYENFIEYNIIEHIVKRTDIYFEKSLPKSEKLFLTTMLLYFSDISPQASLVYYDIHYTQATYLVDQILMRMNEKYGFQFQNSEELWGSLVRTLIPMSIGMQYGIIEQNNWCTNLRFNGIIRDPVAQHMGYIAANIIQNLMGKNMCKEKIYQLSYCFMNDIRRRAFEVNKKSILIFPPSGYESAQLLKEELQLMYGQYIKKIDIQEMYLVDRRQRLERYDLILGLIPSYSDGIPAISLEQLSMENRYEDIANILLKELKAPKIIPYLSANNIFLNLNFKTKEEVLNFLICNNHNDVQERIKSRESVLSYDCGNGIVLVINFDVPQGTRLSQLLTFSSPFIWEQSEVKYVLHLEMCGNITSSELWTWKKILEKIFEGQSILENTYLENVILTISSNNL